MKAWRFFRVLTGFILLLAAVVLVSEFTRRDSASDFGQIQVGMTAQQVMAILGPPVDANRSDPSAPLIWAYHSGTISFVNDKVNKLAPELK